MKIECENIRLASRCQRKTQSEIRMVAIVSEIRAILRMAAKWTMSAQAQCTNDSSLEAFAQVVPGVRAQGLVILTGIPRTENGLRRFCKVKGVHASKVLAKMRVPLPKCNRFELFELLPRAVLLPTSKSYRGMPWLQCAWSTPEQRL
jgi:hypothetical protein